VELLGALDRPGAKPDELSRLASAWRAHAGDEPGAVAAAHRAAGVRVLLLDDPDYPEAIRIDHEPPAVLFVHGDLALLSGPRVAVVGTRRCTGSGAAVARDLGRELAAAGVAVVSGLALGIDGAAHAGALTGGERAGPPIGVIGCGHDRPYPRQHTALWGAVRARGMMVGECPLGTPPASWRFPARNRVIAALADVLVVVESHAVGGSLLTVQEAIDRDVPVMAVPGSVRSPATAGTNQLLADGCPPVRDLDDVLVALGLHTAGRRGRVDRRRRPGAEGADVLAALGWEPATLEQLVVRTGRSVLAVSLALHELEVDGWVALDGSWYEQVAAG
jgi:DNA processing protein